MIAIAVFRLRNSLRLLLLGGCLTLCGTSCNKQLDIESSRLANEEGHWSRYEDARSGLMGMYGLFRAAIANNNSHWMWGELRNGDFHSLSRPDLKAVIEGNLNATYPLIQEITNWRRFYAVINACNLFIERADGCLADKRYTESYYKLDVAQARAIRAFAYFYMSRIWGDVPLITASNDGGNFETLPRTSQQTVLSFAEQELIDAAQRLPYLYSGDDPEQLYPPNYYGVNQTNWAGMLLTKLSAYSVLAHIAAWQGHYGDAFTYSDFIVKNYSKGVPGDQANIITVNDLVSPSGLFKAAAGNYRQLIGFSFIRENGETTTDGHFEQLAVASTIAYPMSKQLPDIYVPKNVISEIFPRTEPYDIRFGTDTSTKARLLYTNYFENYDAQVPVFKKIRIVDGGNNITGKFAVFNSSIVFTRLEEIKLLRAEALAALGRNAEAVDELNSIRGLRGVSGVNLKTGADLIYEIFSERRRELMGEGWRWYDLVRYHRLKRNDPAFNVLLDQGGIYWPIAQEVLARNPKILQNTYWLK